MSETQAAYAFPARYRAISTVAAMKTKTAKPETGKAAWL